MKPPIDITGQRFGKLTAIRVVGSKNGAIWEFKCDCGGVKISGRGGVVRSRYKVPPSCGCISMSSVTTHKRTRTRLYKIWQKMKERCLNPKANRWKNYGGRGVKVCSRWVDSFENFAEDMEGTYANHLSLDRINNDGDYCKENCRWATPIEQAGNSSNAVHITLPNGEKVSLSEFARRVGLKPSLVTMRRLRGWPEHRLGEPVKNARPVKVLPGSKDSTVR